MTLVTTTWPLRITPTRLPSNQTMRSCMKAARLPSWKSRSITLSARGPGGDQTGTLRSPSDDPAFQQLCSRLAIFDTDEEILLQIGTQLFNALFSGAIGKLYASSRSMLKEDQGSSFGCVSPPVPRRSLHYLGSSWPIRMVGHSL